jgi:hypothetical protein
MRHSAYPASGMPSEFQMGGRSLAMVLISVFFAARQLLNGSILPTIGSDELQERSV